MNIAVIALKKMDHADPRYPDPVESGGRPLRDVYLLTAMLDDGTEQEASFCVLQDMTPSHTAAMLKTFAYAVEKMEIEQAA